MEWVQLFLLSTLLAALWRNYVSVSLCNFALSEVYIGFSSIVEGAVGILFSMCNLWLSSSNSSPKHIMFMFWPSKWRSRKSPTCNGNQFSINTGLQRGRIRLRVYWISRLPGFYWWARILREEDQIWNV